MTSDLARSDSCRTCGSKDLTKIFSFGPTPPANAFLRREDLDKYEPFFPLDVYFCRGCTLVQLLDIVSPELLFRNYVYVSSTSPSFIAHFRSFAKEVTDRFSFPKDPLAVDIGSNDGILLKPFREFGMRVLGVDPAIKIAEQATKEGIETLPHFFDTSLAERISKEYGQASVITGTNVFAHVHDIHELLRGVKTLLVPDGMFVVEAPYLVDFLEKNLFDTVYHEHVSYFSVRSLSALFALHGMEIFDVQKVSSHGGSIRVFVKKKESSRPSESSVEMFLFLEREKKIDTLAPYLQFAKAVEENKVALCALLKELKSQHKRIAGYGAPAKGNTLLNYFGIGSDMLDYIVDDSTWKQGLYTPGTHIPVVSAASIASEKPDYLFILAWNFAGQIMDKLADYKAAGGKFIIPVPKPHIV